MKFWFAILAGMLLVAGGCASRQPAPAFSDAPEAAPSAAPVSAASPAANPPVSRKKSESEPKLIVTPENFLAGTVATYNSAGRFVVLDFPVGKMPGRDQVLFVYRQGLKVGEVKVTGPERDYNTVADLISGEVQKGDEVRDR